MVYNWALVLAPCCCSLFLGIVVNFLCIFLDSPHLSLLSTLQKFFIPFVVKKCGPRCFSLISSQLTSVVSVLSSHDTRYHLLDDRNLHSSRAENLESRKNWGPFFTCFLKYLKHPIFLSIRVQCIFILAFIKLQSYVILYLRRIQYSRT